MVKSIISMLVVLSLLIGISVFEQVYVKKSFKELEEVLQTLQEKVEDETAVKDDAYSVQKYWLVNKSDLHAYIPHNDVKEIDYWLAETVSLIESKNYALALAKLEMLIEVCEHIPGTFLPRFENIF